MIRSIITKLSTLIIQKTGPVNNSLTQFFQDRVTPFQRQIAERQRPLLIQDRVNVAHTQNQTVLIREEIEHSSSSDESKRNSPDLELYHSREINSYSTASA